MSIRSGVYRLRVGPASGVGGMFATRGSIGEPISVAPATPEFMERQAVRPHLTHFCPFSMSDDYYR